MKKTFREKYFEVKKENEYLHIIINNKHTDFKIMQLEFERFKSDLKKKEEKNEKQSFIVFLIGLGIISVFGLLSVILGSLGLL